MCVFGTVQGCMEYFYNPGTGPPRRVLGGRTLSPSEGLALPTHPRAALQENQLSPCCFRVSVIDQCALSDLCSLGSGDITMNNSAREKLNYFHL